MASTAMATMVSISTESTTVHFSDGFDSDAAAAILQRTFRRRPSTGSRDARQAVPGTRRFRRYLNNLVSGEDSGSDYYSASEGEGGGGRRADEVEEEVWRSEWRGEFVAVGSDFFERADTKVERGERGHEGGNRAQRRLQRMERERKERRQQRKERLERRQKRLAAVEVMDGGAQPTPSHSIPDTAVLELTGPSSSAGVDRKVDEEGDADEAMEVDSLIASNDALLTDLWLQVEKPVRSVLRRLTDYSFVRDVEQLLLAFKHHMHQQQQMQQLHSHLPPAPFHSSLPPSPHYRVLPSMMAGELIILMPEPFLRFLTYGALAFHFMHHVGANRRGQTSEDDGIVVVRMQRGWINHHCSLASYLETRSAY